MPLYGLGAGRAEANINVKVACKGHRLEDIDQAPVQQKIGAADGGTEVSRRCQTGVAAGFLLD